MLPTSLLWLVAQFGCGTFADWTCYLLTAKVFYQTLRGHHKWTQLTLLRQECPTNMPSDVHYSKLVILGSQEAIESQLEWEIWEMNWCKWLRLKPLPFIKTLNVCWFRNFTLSLLQLSSLQCLQCKHCVLSHNEVCDLISLPHLHTIFLKRVHMVAYSFATLLSCPNLTHLSCHKITCADPQHSIPTRRYCKLQTLDLHINLHDKWLIQWCLNIAKTAHSISLRGIDVGEFENLLQECVKVKFLSLQSNKWTNECDLLDFVSHFPYLQSLTIYCDSKPVLFECMGAVKIQFLRP